MDLYLGEVCFESCLAKQPLWLRVFVIFLRNSKLNSRTLPQLGHKFIAQNPLQLISHLSILCYLVYVTCKVVEKVTSRKVEERGSMYRGCFRRNSKYFKRW